jgi:hypothetical protein
MKWNRIAVLVITLCLTLQAKAEAEADTDNIIAGVSLGLVSTDESDTNGLGFVAGYVPTGGFGFEVFYLKSMSDDSVSVSGASGDVKIDTWGIFGVYKSTGDIYVKGKAGIGVVNLEFDIDGGDSVKESESGLAIGLAVGATLGPGDLELSYTIMSNLGEFDNSDVEADTDILAVTYLWYL